MDNFVNNSNNTITQIGNNNSAIFNNYGSEIETLISRIDKDFQEGNINDAMAFLDKAIEEHSQNKKAQYALYIKKIAYLLELKNIENAKQYMQLLSKKYSDFLNIQYHEHNLILYAFDQNEKEYFESIEEIKLEFINTKSDNYFMLLYYLNSGDINNAKSLLLELQDNELADSPLICGHIYANSYRFYNNEHDLIEAEKYYNIVLNQEISFLVKLHIVGFFVTNIINNFFQTKNEFDESKILEYKDILEIIFTAQKYLNPNYLQSLKNTFLTLLIILQEKDAYIKFYERNEDQVFDEHYLQYILFKDIDVDHEKIQMRISEHSNLLVSYASLLLVEKNRQSILEFFDNKQEWLYKNNLLIYFYTIGKIKQNQQLSEKLIQYIYENHDKEVEICLSYLSLKNSNKIPINDAEADVLIELVRKETIIFARFCQVIDFLDEIKKYRKSIELSISKIYEYEQIILFVLQKMHVNLELSINDFEYFINYIDKYKYAAYIADIYFKFDRLDKTFEYLQMIWKKEENIHLAINLLTTTFHFFQRFGKRIHEGIEDEALLYLQSQQKILNLQDIHLITSFALNIQKNINTAFGIINKKILATDVYSLSNAEKEQLASIYLSSIVNFKDNEMDEFENNLVYFKNDKYYLYRNNFNNLHLVYFEKFNLELIDLLEYQAIKLDKTYEKKSLFHSIINQILSSIKSSNFQMLKIDVSSENPLENLQQVLILNNVGFNSQLENYSNGAKIGFFNLAGEYEKYFNLVIYLLENNEITFHPCQCNYKDVTVKKLLTLSSIIYLQYYKKLAMVLKREDIFIQYTLYNWLYQYISDLEKKDEIFSIFAKDGFFYKDIVNKEEIVNFSNTLKEIISTIKISQIVDDTVVTLPFKGAFDLSKNLGAQEYQALAFYHQNNYQIITEDRIFEDMFDALHFDQSMISSAAILL